LIVGATSQAKIVYRRFAASSHGKNVVEFQELARLATAAADANEGAPPAIAHPDSPPDLSSDMTALATLVGAGPASTGQRLSPDSEPPLLFVFDRNTK
jgi:hypothetical protein